VSPLDPRLIGLTLAVALATALMAGALPALRASRGDVVAGLRRETRSTTGALRGGATLLALQAALGIVLVAGAAVTVRSFAGIVFGDPGYDVEGLYNVSVQHGYTPDQPRNGVSRISRAEEVVRGFSGVEAAGATSRYLSGHVYLPEDAFWTDRGQTGTRIGVGGGLFAAMGTAMIAGREFSDQEVQDVVLVAVVNRAAASQLWPAVTPAEVLGRTVTTADGVRTVVGVAQDIRRRLPAEPIVPSLFVPITATEAPCPHTSSSPASRRSCSGRLR
jgi:hypothetical protein